jgi:hypothetical protein
MAFSMASLKRLKSGAFSARKVIPKDMRDDYRARFGGGWEERFYAKPGTPRLGKRKVHSMIGWPNWSSALPPFAPRRQDADSRSPAVRHLLLRASGIFGS